MWLPSTLYERLPQFWLVVGGLLMIFAVYIGFDYKWFVYYFGVGLVSCLWSVAIIVLRSRRRSQSGHRNESAEDQGSDPD